MHVTELLDDTEFTRIFPLVTQLNSDLTEAQFTGRLREMRAQG